MTLHHRVYGLRIASNQPVPGLEPVPAAERVDCTITFEAGEDVRPRTIVHTGDTGVVISRSEDDYLFAYADGNRFVVTADAVRCLALTTPEDAATYLLGPVLAFVLRLRGALSLHASAIEVEGRAIVVAAAHGEGKSTTAAGFARRGHAILSDDVVPLSVDGGRVIAQPGYPRLRLWPETAGALFGELPLLTPNWSKRYLDLAAQFRDTPAAVAAIYVLGPFSEGAPAVVPLAGGAAAIRLIQNTSMNVVLDAAMRARELELVAAVLERVPVAEARPARGLERLDAFCETLIRHSRGVY